MHRVCPPVVSALTEALWNYAVTMTATSIRGDADIARVAALIGDRARARVLLALADGRALPASVLAAEAAVTPSTISEHLARLTDANLLTAERQGRARYFRLADASVAEALEAIARISPPQPIRSLRQGTRAHALRRARTCYNHLAGRLGVALMTTLLQRGLLAGGDGRHHPEAPGQDRLSAPGRDVAYKLTPTGRRELSAFGLDLDEVCRRHPAIRYCLDWSEQHHHLAGPLGTALTSRLLELDWIQRTDRGRAVILTDRGRDGLRDTFGLAEGWDHDA
jgi:DNA-binding transcriptional ArsR family regulator